MLRTRVFCCLLLLTPLVVSPAADVVAEDVLQVVPHDVLGVAVLRNAAEAQRKLNALRAQLPLPIPDIFAIMQQQLGDLRGVDRDGSLAVAAVPGVDATGPASVYFVAISDYDQLLESVEADEPVDGIAQATVAQRPMLIARKGDYAVLADAPDRAALSRTLQTTRHLAQDMAGLAERVARTDAYAAATPAGIRMAQEQLLAGLAGVRAQLEQQGEMASQGLAGIEMYESLFRSLDQEITHALAGIRLEEDNSVRLLLSALLADGGTLAEMGKAAKPSGVDVLAELPATEFLFAGGGVLPEQWGQQLVGLSTNAMQMYFGDTGLSEQQLQQMAELSARSMRGMRSMSMVMGLTEPGEPLYGNSILVIRVDDAPAYMDNYAAAMDEMTRLMAQMDEPPFSYRSERIELAGRPGLRIDMQMKGLLGGEDAPPQIEEMFKMMFGSADQISFFLAARDKQTVLGTYISQQRLEQLLKQPVTQPLGREPGVARTLGMLPEDAHAIGLWSVRGTFAFVRRMIGAVAAEQGAAIPEFPASPPIGLAATLSAQRLDADVVVPHELLQAAAAFAEQIQAGQLQGPDQP
jgi:hypothetical protein